MPGSAAVLFDDIPSREPLLWFHIRGQPYAFSACVSQACYFDSILNAYCVRLGGCLADHLAERIEKAT
jgi:hypothetical protein